MRGHVAKKKMKDGTLRYYPVVFLGYDDLGKKKYKWLTGHSSKKAAEKELNKAIRDIDTGGFVEPTKETVETYMTRWLANKETQVRYNTFRKYRWLTTNHVIPVLGKIELVKLTPQRLESFYAQLQKADKPLSSRSVLHIHNMLHEALSKAVKWGITSRNVTEAVDPPRVENKEMQTWSSDDVATFLEYARGYRYYMVFLLAIATGMRKAEICGLRWSDVDLENGRITVQQSLVYVTGKGAQFQELKTAKSRRVVTLPEYVVAELKRHRAALTQERWFFGPAYQDFGLVNCKVDGGPVYFRTVDNQWYKCMEESGVPKIRFHDLRHTHASLLFQQGVESKLVSERLGHARVSITNDIYIHTTNQQHEEVAKQINDSLFSPRNRATKSSS